MTLESLRALPATAIIPADTRERERNPMPLAANEIECELSYAYLHAVATKAGCECQVTLRHSDGMGVDARLFVDEEFGPGAVQCRFTVEVQLKATSAALKVAHGRFSFRLRKEHYDKLRRTDIESPLLLIVLQPRPRLLRISYLRRLPPR